MSPLRDKLAGFINSAVEKFGGRSPINSSIAANAVNADGRFLEQIQATVHCEPESTVAEALIAAYALGLNTGSRIMKTISDLDREREGANTVQ